MDFDFFTVDECARTAAYVHEHKISAIGFDFGVVSRNPGISDDEISVRLAADRKGYVIQRNSTLLRAVHEDYFRERTSRRTDCRRGSWDRHGDLLRSWSQRIAPFLPQHHTPAHLSRSPICKSMVPDLLKQRRDISSCDHSGFVAQCSGDPRPV